MTSKNLFFKLLMENMKRRIWTLALGFLVFFFSLPVAMAYNFTRKIYTSEPVDYILRVQGAALDLVGRDNIFIIVVVLVAAVICGASSFAYLHSKKKVDFYHSIPVRRETLFWVAYINGMLIMVLVYFVNLVLAMGIMTVNGMTAHQFLGTAMKTFGVHMIYYWLMYTTAVLAMLLTGNLIIGLLMDVVLNLWGPACFLLVNGCHEEFFSSFYSSGDNWMKSAMSHSSPFVLYMDGYAEILEKAPHMGPKILTAAAVTIALMVISLLLYKLRPSEAAGKALACRKLYAPVKALLVIPTTIGAGLIFRIWGESDGWMIFGMFSGLVISHGIIEIIYHFDFKKLFANMRQMGVCAALALLFVAVFRFDLTGYDSYLPDASQVESAAVAIYGVDDWVDYRTAVLQQMDNGRSYISYEYTGFADHIFENMKLTDTESVLALAQKGIERIQSLEGRIEPDTVVYSAEEEMEGIPVHQSVYVQYRLNSGRVVRRAYYLNLVQNRELVDRICENQQYREGVFPIFTDLGDAVTGINFSVYGREHLHVAKDDPSMVKKLVETYQKEFGSLTQETRREEAPVGILTFKTAAIQSIADQLRKDPNNNEWTELNYMNEYPIYPSFTGTIALLNQAGISVERGYEAEDVAYASVGERRPYGQDEDGKVYNMKVTDKEQIAELLNLGIAEQYMEMNPLYFGGKGGIDVFMELVPEEVDGVEIRDNYSYFIPKDKIPAYISDSIVLSNSVYRQGY